MKRNIIGVLAGLATGIILITAIEMLSGMIYPIPAGTDLSSPTAMKTFMASMPLGPIVFLLAGYAVGSFGGGLIASYISMHIRQAITIGVVLTVGNILNLSEVPHPAWLAVVSTIIFVPFAYLGGKTGMRMKPAKPDNL